jgi:hypothetical protein
MCVLKDQARSYYARTWRWALTPLLLLLALSTPCHAQVNNVDWELQEIYEHYTGVSLAEAVLKLRAVPKQFPDSPNNVYVQLNGGGDDNKLYAGQNNTLQLYISNQDTLAGFTLGLKFTCDADSFALVPNYGTSGPQSVVNVHTDAFEPGYPWYYDDGIRMITASSEDSIIVAGLDLSNPRHNPIPPHQNLTLLLSMQIWIPPETPPEDSGFSVDDILIPPAGVWEFSPKAGGKVVPDFQGEPNLSDSIPDAPPVYFDISDGSSYDPRAKSEFPNVRIPPKDWPHVVKDYEHHPAIYRDASGETRVMAYMVFEGNQSDLKELGVTPIWTGFGNNTIAVSFPLGILPEACCVKGVLKIQCPDRQEIK